jgi:ribosome-associated protein
VPATTEAIALTRLAAEAAASKKGSDLVAFDVSEQIGITDVFLIATATNERQVGAVVDAVEERLIGQSTKPLRREGGRENRWVLLDYGDIVVHVQHTDERRMYALERLWRDCPRISLDGIETPLAADDEDDPAPGLLTGERPGR